MRLDSTFSFGDTTVRPLFDNNELGGPVQDDENSVSDYVSAIDLNFILHVY